MSEKKKEHPAFPFFKSKLAIRLSLYIFGIAIGIALLLGTVDVIRKYQIEKGALQQEFTQIEKINLPAIEENLWILNLDSLQTILDGLLQRRNFIYFKVEDERGKTLVEAGTLPKTKENTILKKVPLYHTDSYGKRIYLGKLTIVATTRYIQKELLHNTLSSFGILLVTMLLVGFFILMLIWILITKHLFKIRKYTDDIRFDRELPPLKLDRKVNYWTQDDVLSSLVNAFNRMYETIQHSYQKLEHQSLHDPLTDLPNRRFLKIDLTKRIEECRKTGKYAVLYFIDLDFFKVLNDSLGHNIGDAVLIEVAKRLKSLEKRHGVKAYRLGGDEFLILTQPLSESIESTRESALLLVEEIQRIFDKSITLKNRTIKITASIGIELFKEAENVETIIKHADNALYQAKESGRNRYAFFHATMQSNADKRLEMEQILHRAIQNDEFITYFQPKFDCKQRIRSAETLIRLEGADGKLIAPGDFIPLAQETGLILEIDRIIVRKVFKFILQNREKIEKTGIKSIAVNISPNQFIMENFPDFIISEAKRFEIDPSFIILEITEEAMVSNVEYALETMQKLKRHGFRFSIDDFGTGYSSMRYLMQFPLDELKIDKSFIDHILDNERSAAIVQTIITLAQNLHLDVVAEGVETKEQLEAVRRYGEVLIQGYIFSPPLPKERFLELL